MSEIDLVDSQLNILLNLCYLKDKRDFSVHSPLLDTDVFDVKLERSEWICEPSTDLETFKNKVEKARGKVSDHNADEVPGTDALRTVLIAAGAFGLEDFEDDLLRAMKRLKGNMGAYSLCFDTNVLYKGFVSSTLTHLLEEEGLSEVTTVVLSNMVSNEVREKHNRRYKRAEVENLVEAAGGKYEGFTEQYKLVSRKAKIAQDEMDYIDKNMKSIFHGDKDHIDDNEKRDIRIIEEYERSKKETGKKPMLLGFEKDFPEKVKDFDVDFVLLEQPDPSKAQIDYKNLYRVLRYTAQVFGYVNLRALGCGLRGVWQNMHDDEFMKGKVKLSLDDETDFSEEIKEAVETSSAVRKEIG